jgi:hypothetical protein
MPSTECYCCGGTHNWSWTDAFAKFGFNDGDGQIETSEVESVLSDAGYEVRAQGWGLRNTVIVSIMKDGVELIPHDDPNVKFGYDDPREYLPDSIVQLLDTALPDP